jgi:hypothetical protein
MTQIAERSRTTFPGPPHPRKALPNSSSDCQAKTENVGNDVHCLRRWWTEYVNRGMRNADTGCSISRGPERPVASVIAWWSR